MATTIEAARAAPEEVIAIVAELASELHPGPRPALHLDATLDGDAGLDSLTRVELLLRLERRFGVSLPEGSAMSSRTVRDLANALARASAAARGPSTALPARPEATRGAPDAAATLVDVLDWQAEHHGDRVHVDLVTESGEVERITYARLLEEAERVATGLRANDVGPGESVALMLPTCPEYLFAFAGCLLAGAVPVPVYPPHGLDRIEEHLVRQAKILESSRSVALVTIPQALPLARLLRARLPGLRVATTGAELASHGRERIRIAANPATTAFLQYTSGSTGDPKGVILTHANLLANIRAMGKAARVESTDVFVSWLPLYHDMGLIGAWLGGLYHAFRLVLLSPLAFLSRPERWLRAIHEHRATLSAAPNFAYELCAKRLPDAQLEGLDLSSWRLAFSGAEPVRPHTVRAFCERFEPYGFKAEAMSPAYGLAECSVGLTFPPLGRGPRIDRIRREPFETRGRAEPTTGDDALEFVSCGRPLPGHEVRFVDEAGREVAERELGRLELRGPSATSGYFGNAAATAKLVRDGWVDSGDYGYLSEGEVFLTGRAKDVIIRGGRKIYPYELEAAIEALPGIVGEGTAAIASASPETGAERLIVVAETAAPSPELAEKIRKLTLEVLQVPADDVVLVPPRSIPKTANGKIRRAACREQYERGELGRSGPAPKRQLLRFWASSARPRLARGARLVREHAFAAWAWLVAGVILPPAALLVLVLPSLAWRRGVLRATCRLLLALTRTPITVKGLDVPLGRPCVVVANHASYLDGLIVAAVLPPRFSFVAKIELLSHRLAALLLRRLGTTFVERFDPKLGVEGAAQLVDAVKRGESLVIFPEGTFARAPGLLPFHMGAFAVAARTGVPVVPVAIRGMRSLLRGEEMFPHRVPVDVTISPEIRADGSDWSAAVRLREAARARIAADCGEPEVVERAP